MTLSRFILENMEEILAEWERFARSIPCTSGMDVASLRDDAKSILVTIAYDIQSSQSSAEQQAKSQGKRDCSTSDPRDTAAEVHGRTRFGEGFTLSELVSEFRALRATVIRLWVAHPSYNESDAIYAMTRFNEGIDTAVAQSLARFSSRLDQSREIFMGALGHDLRTPLQVIASAAAYLRTATANSPQQQSVVDQIERSTKQISAMVRDLLDVARTRLGGVFPIDLAPMDAVDLCNEITDEFKQLFPKRALALTVNGDAKGTWDRARLNQLLSNLVRNAFQHGAHDQPVTLSVVGADDHVSFSVHNHGEPIPPELLPHVFEPMSRVSTDSRSTHDSGSLGLGLHIACEVARAHGGSIKVSSTKTSGTEFCVRLPRHDHRLE